MSGRVLSAKEITELAAVCNSPEWDAEGLPWKADVTRQVLSDPDTRASVKRIADTLLVYRAVVDAARKWDKTLSEFCDGPERDELHAALADIPQDDGV